MEVVKGEEQRRRVSGSVGSSTGHELAGGGHPPRRAAEVVPKRERPRMTGSAHGTSSDRPVSSGKLRETSGEIAGTAQGDQVSLDRVQVRVRQEGVGLSGAPVHCDDAARLARVRCVEVRITSSDSCSWPRSMRGDPKTNAGRSVTVASRSGTTAVRPVATVEREQTIASRLHTMWN